METIFLFYGYFLVILIVTFLIGYGIFASMHLIGRMPDFFSVLFFSLLLGSIVIVFFTSIICTHFKTISLAFIPLFIALFYEYRKTSLQAKPKTKFVPAISKENVFWIIIGSLVIFLFGFLLFYQTHENYFIIPSNDITFYGEVSYFILHTGQENYFHVLNLYSSDYNGVAPYHYFELWFNGAWASVLHINSSQCLFFLVYPFFAFCYYLGIWSVICIMVGNKAARYFVFPFIGLFSAGICFSFYNHIPFLHNVSLVLRILYPLFFAKPKISIVSCFFTAFFILYHSGNFRIAFIALFFLPVCSINVLPGVYGGFFLFYFLSVFFHFTEIKKCFPAFVLCLIQCICIFIFYVIFPVPGASKSLFNVSSSMHSLSNISSVMYAKNSVGFLITYFVLVIVIYLPFMMVNLKSLLHSVLLQNFFLLFLCITFCGVAAAALSFTELNNYQLFDSSSFGLANLLIICMAVWQLNNVNSYLLRAGTILIILVAIGVAAREQVIYYPKSIVHTGKDYIKGVSSLIDKYRPERGVSLISSNDCLHLPLPVTTYVGGMYIPFYLSERLMPVSISDFTYKINNPAGYRQEYGLRLQQAGIFYRFVEGQKKRNIFKNIDQSQIDFITEFHIDFVVISAKAPLSRLLQEKIAYTTTDSVTGDQFAILKNK